MNLFLKVENWLANVEGMDKDQIRTLARNARPDLRKGVNATVLRYLAKTVTNLENVEHTVHVAMGDYTGCDPLSPPMVDNLF